MEQRLLRRKRRNKRGEIHAMENIGKIVQVSGPVVDVEFEGGSSLPAIKDALYDDNNCK